MKKTSILIAALLIYLLGVTTLLFIKQKQQEQEAQERYIPITIGAPDAGQGESLYSAFGKLNTNLSAHDDSLAARYRKSEIWKIISDSLGARIAKAKALTDYTWLKGDSGKLSNPISLWYFNENAPGGSTGGFDFENSQFIVGTTSGAPINGTAAFTMTDLAGKEILLYRGTDEDLPLQHLNRSDSNTVTGYRFNSSGKIVVRPAFATGERARIMAYPTTNSNWIEFTGGSTPTAYFTETFEGTGYSTAGWDETVGAGSTVNEDATAVTPPTGGGSQTLLLQKVSPNYNAYTYYELAANQTVTYTTIYYYVSAHGITAGNTLSIFGLYEAGYGASIASASLYVDSYDSNRLKVICGLNNTGSKQETAYPGSGSALALNTWYRFDIKYDIPGDTYEFKITPAGGSAYTVMSGTLTSTHPTNGMRIIHIGTFASATTVTNYYDNIGIGTDGYLTTF